MRFLVLLFSIWSLSAFAGVKVEYYDELNKLNWSSYIGYMNYEQALETCKTLRIGKLVWRLPEVEEFKSAEDKGQIRRVMDFKNSWWWSKADHHYYSNLFNGYNGHIDGYMNYNRPNIRAMVRCVGLAALVVLFHVV